MLDRSLRGKLLLVAGSLCLVPFSTPVAHAQKVIATIPVLYATDVSIDPVRGLAYVDGNPDGTAVIREETNNFAGGLPAVGESVAVDPLTDRLYVGGNQSLTVVDTRTGRVVSTVNVPAVGVAVNIVTNKIYTSDFNDNVYVVDGRTNNILKDIAFPEIVDNLAVNPATDRIYVAEEAFPGEVGVIDGSRDKVIATVVCGGDLTFNLGVDYVHNLIYTADQLGTVSVIDGRTNTLKATINVGGEPADVSVDPLRRRAYVDNAQLNAVQVMNTETNKLIATVPVGQSPEYSDIDFYRGRLYVVNSNSGTISVIKTN